MTSATQPHELPEDLDALRALALQQQQALGARDEQIDALAAEVRQLREYLRLLKHQRFGRTSERADAAFAPSCPNGTNQRDTDNHQARGDEHVEQGERRQIR